MPLGLPATPRASELPTEPPGPATFDLGKSVADLHGSKEPVTWAGGALELGEVAEHRPTSALHRDPGHQTWMRWAIGGTVAVLAVIGLIAVQGPEAEADEQAPVEAALVIPEATEPAPIPEPEPAPTPTKAKRSDKNSDKKKTGAAKRDATLAASSPSAAEPSSTATSKTTTTASKSTSASKSTTASKPAPTPSQPTPAPSKPVLAPPEEDAKGASAELPDVAGWDDQDAALGDRSAE